jgi:REP element-mobilizing transposase RayT
MARHLRLEFEGAIYHITSRGNERSDIFADDRDKQRFLEKLAENVESHHVRLYAYVLMPNHYHLLVETPRANLSSFMQQMNTSYTMYYNVKRQRVGHVFSGRYKAKVVAGDDYLLKLTRYIHLNPVKVAGLKMRGTAEKLRCLQGYAWSSYPEYAGLRKRQGWVDYGPLSELTGRYAQEREEGYRRFVEADLEDDDESRAEVLNQSSKAIGDGKFCRWVERKYRQRTASVGEGVDVAMRRVEMGPDADEVLDRVAGVFKVDRSVLKKRRSLGDARLVAARLLKDLTGLTQRAAGRALGLTDGSGFGHLLKLADSQLAKGRSLRRTYEKLRRTF